MNQLSFTQQIHLAKDIGFIALGSPERMTKRAGALPSIQTMEDVVRRLSEPSDKIVAYLFDVIRVSDHTIDSLANFGFTQEILNAVEAVTMREGESYTMCVIRARKNIVGRRVMLEYLRENIRKCKSTADLLKHSRAVVNLVG